MAVTYEPLATTTLSSSASNIEFTSISGSYTDLVLVTSGTASAATNLAFQVNSDTGSNYSATLLKGNGSTASSYRYSSGTSGRLGEVNNSTMGVFITSFQNYSNATTYKTVLTRSNVVSDHTSAWVSLWRSTSAITSIKILPDSGTLSTGFTATLYAVKAA
jgi:hypothetical protein